MKNIQHSNEAAAFPGSGNGSGVLCWKNRSLRSHALGAFVSPSGIRSMKLQGSICLLIAFALLSSGFAKAQSNPEVRELQIALKMTEQKLAHSESQRKDLMKSLAESVRVSEEQTFAAREVQEKMEAFGVDLFSSSKDSLEQRLLKAVRDLDILRQENDRRRKALHELSEAFLKYIAATPETKDNIRGEAQESIAKAGKSLEDLMKSDDIEIKKLERSQVVSIDQKIGLVVLDAGRKSGVRVGTPISINRDDTVIYTALIVDVREGISGALLQDKVGKVASVQVGDQVRPMANATDL